MRYRGGGVGHKYMREIEVKFENMSLERFHGSSRPKPPQGSHTNTRAEDASSGEEEPEDPGQLGGSGRSEEEDPVGLGGLQEDQQPELTSGSTNAGLDGSESDDGDYVPPQTGDSDDEYSTSYEGNSDDNSSADSEVDSDEIESDGSYESYGLGEL